MKEPFSPSILPLIFLNQNFLKYVCYLMVRSRLLHFLGVCSHKERGRKELKSSQQEVKSDSLPTESRLALSLAMSNRTWRNWRYFSYKPWPQVVPHSFTLFWKSALMALKQPIERPCRKRLAISAGYTKWLRPQLIHD